MTRKPKPRLTVATLPRHHLERIASAALGFRDGVKADGTPYRGGDLTDALREAGL